MKFKMVVKTETENETTEYTRYVAEHEVSVRRQAARLSAPIGSTRTVTVAAI